MKKVSELVDAELDFWTARAEGVPADQLEVRPVQRPDPRTPDTICVRRISLAAMRIDYSTNWALCGPLLPKVGGVNRHMFDTGAEWWAPDYDCGGESGKTPLIAICRAVVRAAFGDEVEDLPC